MLTLAVLVAAGSLLLGLFIMFRGRVELDSERVLEGPPVYYVGFLLALPLPLVFASAFILELVGEAQGQALNHGQINRIKNYLDIGIIAAFVLLALLVAVKSGKPAGGQDEEPRQDRDEAPSMPPKDDDPYRGRYE